MNKSIAIIGEGETEWFYFDSMRRTLRVPFRLVPGLPENTDLEEMLELALKYLDKGFDWVFCLIDMDRIRKIAKERSKYVSARGSKKYQKICFIETSPCIEFWFLLHFQPYLSTRAYHSYDELSGELRKHMPKYDKSQRYLRQTNLYRYLQEHGDIQRAVSYSRRLCELRKEHPEDDVSYSEMYRVIELIDQLGCP